MTAFLLLTALFPCVSLASESEDVFVFDNFLNGEMVTLEGLNDDNVNEDGSTVDRWMTYIYYFYSPMVNESVLSSNSFYLTFYDAIVPLSLSIEDSEIGPVYLLSGVYAGINIAVGYFSSSDFAVIQWTFPNDNFSRYFEIPFSLYAVMPVSSGSSGTSGTIGLSDYKPILDAVTGQFSLLNIVGMLAGLIGICVVFVFLWWGAKKGFRAIKFAVMRGKLKM